MPNHKHRLYVRRRDLAVGRPHFVSTFVTPGAVSRGSWWTTASRDGFTAQARHAPPSTPAGDPRDLIARVTMTERTRRDA